MRGSIEGFRDLDSSTAILHSLLALCVSQSILYTNGWSNFIKRFVILYSYYDTVLCAPLTLLLH
jgi:hypothetical protein